MNLIYRIIITFILFFISNQLNAAGTWTPLVHTSPDTCGGVMILLTDGTVMTKTFTDGVGDSLGNIWNKLTPDIHGSYVNGTWTTLAPMHDTRVYCASRMLKDGRLFVAGGEYGSGGYSGETYEPVTDTWTLAPTQNDFFADANSELLPDGRVLVASLSGFQNGTVIYDPVTNSWSNGPTCQSSHAESSWVKLADNSILFVEFFSNTSERYIPSLNQWVPDAVVPVWLYDSFIGETGAGFLLPDGRAFFLGASGHTAFYLPTGNTSPGTWTAGPDIPDSQSTPDAAAAMMMNGNILCAVAPVPFSLNDVFNSPTSYYEFNYLTNVFSQVNAPAGGDTTSEPSYLSNMLDLPDGSVLYGDMESNQYYVYSPGGTQLAAGKPTIGNISTMGCDTFNITGTLFNGISEGAGYGDDWQMATNYPIVRLTKGTNVYYARTFNWNSTGVQRGNSADTTQFTLPANLPTGTYSLVVIANGIHSDTISFTPCFPSGIDETENLNNNSIFVYPNPVDKFVTVEFQLSEESQYEISLIDIFGKTILKDYGKSISGKNSHTINSEGIANGIYTLVIKSGENTFKNKIIIE